MKLYHLGIFLALVILTGCGGFIRGEKTGNIPLTGQYPGLVPIDKKIVNYFSTQDKARYLGNKAPLFDQYGLNSLHVCNFTLDGPENYLTIEAYSVNSSVGAAGIYYYYKGKILYGGGKDVEVGAQGVLDTERESRNLYFYKGQFFYALVYTGKKPVPDLVPLAREIADRTMGENFKPKGFEYLDVKGISTQFARVTWGNALNTEFLPPSVMALAWAAGKEAKIYVSSYNNKKDMEDSLLDFRRYLQLEAPDFKESRIKVGEGDYKLYTATDSTLGVIMVAVFEDNIITLVKPESLDKGMPLIRAIIEKARSLRYAR